jgi:hypothetical protein
LQERRARAVPRLAPEKAAERGIAATLVVADVLDLESLRRRFRTVLDTARRQ